MDPSTSSAVSLWVPFLALPLMPLFWVSVTWILGRLSGWSRIDPAFRLEAEFLGPTVIGSARIGFINYNHVLHIGFDDEALYLAVSFLFRVGHPPLRLPLPALRVRKKSGFLVKYVRVEVGGVCFDLHRRALLSFSEVRSLPSPFQQALA